GSTGSGATASHTYAADGTYTISLTVTDPGGLTGTVTHDVTVSAAPQPPQAAFTATPAGLSVSVDGSGSSDPEGGALSYVWDFGDGSTGSGATASHTYAADGTYTISLTVTDPGGLTDTVTHDVTVSAPVAPTELATDTFGRTLATGWGDAEVGGSWSVLASSSYYSVDGTSGLQVIPRAGATLGAFLESVSADAVDLTAKVAVDQAQTGGGTYLSLVGRQVGSSSYSGRVRLLSTGSVLVQIVRDSTSVASAVVPGMTYTPGDLIAVRVRVAGTSPTTISARAWPAGDTEPTDWLVQTTDSTAALQMPGYLGLMAYLSGSSTSVPTTVRWNDLHVTVD
ncbi:PKD domain-containing protein, partial [Isoptericola sp. b490]|uniref:PKD domain-containing protein n=1 Tax=Actinotalea lenta TaxID=3064654 RepID=UPI002713EE1D